MTSPDYTPGPERMKAVYVTYTLQHGFESSLEETEAQFERFINNIRREAWDEGYGDCWNYHQSNGLAGTYRNPYRTAEQETGHDD